MLLWFFRYRKEFDVRSFDDLNFLCFFFRKRFDDHGIIDNVFFRFMDLGEFLYLFSEDLFCRCEGSFDRGCCCALRAYQVDLGCRVSCTAFEVTVGSTNGDSLCCRSLSDRTARSAGDLKDPDSGIDQHVDISVTQQFFVSLSGCDSAGTAYVFVYLSSLEYEGCFCHICVACICTASDKYLLYRFSLNIFERDHVIRLMRT